MKRKMVFLLLFVLLMSFCQYGMEEKSLYEWRKTVNRLSSQGKHDSAIKIYKKSVLPKLEINSKEYINEYFNLGKEYSLISELDSTLKINKKIDSIASLLGYYGSKAKAQYNIASVYMSRKEYSEALSHLHISKDIYLSTNDSLMYGICLRGLGSIYKKINDFKTATSYYHIALEVFFDLNYLAGQSSCYNSLGSLARKIKEYSSGIDNYRKGYYISLTLNKPIKTTKFLTNIANIFNETKQYDSARYYYSKAFNIATDYNSVKQQGIILENWGELSYRDEKYHLAEQQLNKAYIIYSGLKYEKGVINILTLQAKVYLSTNRIALASRKIQQSLAMLKETNYPESLLMALETQRDINAKKADFRAAFGTQLRLDSLKDALHEKQKAEAVVNANIKFQTKLTQEQNEKLKVENLANTLKIENLRKKLLIVLLSSLLTIIILVFWYIHSINKKKHAILLKEAEAQRNIRKLKDNISSDLHDVIGGEIFGVLLKYQLLEETGEDSPFKLSDMNAEFSEVYEKIRKYSRKLRKVDRKSITFAESILNLVNDFEASTKSKIETNVSEYDWSSLKDETKEHLYYSIQECVQNAVKYSEAEFIKIHFNKRRNTTQIQIIDNGVGFDTEHIVDSNGLINVQERVNEINGTLTINSKINKGTEIKISIEEKK